MAARATIEGSIDAWIQRRVDHWTPWEITEERSRTYVGLVDIVFAVIIGQSFVRFTETGGDLVSWSTFVLGSSYFTVVLSWLRYHEGISHTRYRHAGRLPVDLLILFAYWLLVSFYDQFALILLAYAAIFWLYSIWFFLDATEWTGRIPWVFRSARYAICATAIAAVYLLGGQRLAFWPLGDASGEAVFLTAIFVTMLCYRFPPWSRPQTGRRKIMPRVWGAKWTRPAPAAESEPNPS